MPKLNNRVKKYKQKVEIIQENANNSHLIEKRHGK